MVMLGRQSALRLVALTSILLGSAGCVVLPRYTRVQPAISFIVVDPSSRVAAGAELYFLRHQYPYGLAVRTDRHLVDDTGLVELPTIREWQAIMPFMMHGTTSYSWSWCAQAPGFGPEVGRVWDEVPATPIEVKLGQSRTRYRCEDFKHGVIPPDFRTSDSRPEPSGH